MGHPMLQFALVKDGAFVPNHEGTPVTSGHLPAAPEDYAGHHPEGCVWLPIEYRDAMPFDAAEHYRLSPVYEIEDGKVFRTYPIIPKIEYHAKEIGLSPDVFRAMLGKASI